MPTSPSTVEYTLEQMHGAGAVRARKMFGEYTVYCDDGVVGVICRDQLYLKPTNAGATLEPGLVRAPPYKGAKPSMVIPADLLDDPDRLSALVRATARELPVPKKKRKTLPSNA